MDGFAVLLALVIVVGVAYGFQLWIRHQRRLMVHRERLAAIEKGIELPPLEQEIQRRSWNTQRLLLFAGLVWISVGIAAFPLLLELAGTTLDVPWGYGNDGNPFFARLAVPHGAHWIALAPISIGLSHVIVYLVGRQKEGRGADHDK